MPFKSLPAQTPINPAADAYAAQALEESRRAAEESWLTYDITYGDDPAQAIDVYAPARGVSGAPVLVFFHGGNFTHGFKEWCGFMAPAITAFPAVFVAASYRLSPSVSYRDILRDCFAAVARAREVAADHGGDPDRIYVGGHSAGGQIAALMVLRDDWRAESGLPAGVIRGAFPMSANFRRRLGSLEPDETLRVSDDTPDSPMELARRLDVPVVVAWGDSEKPYVLEEGPAFVAALQAAGTRAEGIVLPDADHFTAHTRMADPAHPLVARMREVMTRG